MFGFLSSWFLPPHPVNTAEEALNIAQAAINSKWPDDYSLYESSLSYDESSEV